jgi:hypothetical protein
MPDRYAPALLLDVLALWFVLRWVLSAAMLLLFARVLLVMLAVGLLVSLGQDRFVSALFFAAATVLCWMLMRRGRRARQPTESRTRRLSPSHAWRRVTSDEIGVLCERRIGDRVDAAAPITITDQRCVLALAGNAVWVLEDGSSSRHPEVGRVLARWSRDELVSHVEPSGRGQRLELSWPRHGALVRGLMPAGTPADAFTGQLVADELARRG